LTDKALFTGVVPMLDSPLCMSPELAGMSDLDVDTRSDIYALGVLLYELLTGTTPFPKERFKRAAYDEIRRIIREEEPPRPSTRLSESMDSLPSISARRKTEPANLTKLIRGELDWIVMKALEKDRNRRYETTNGFAADVRRYLNGEPVQACPPSAGYRLRKFARRNKAALVMASVIGVALLLAVGSLGWVVRDREAGRVRTAGEVNQFLQQAESLYADNKLPEAVAEVQKARGVLESGSGDADLGRRVRQ
jgi:eukaryotic-like serine/threonine-protein kinase